MTLNWPVTDVRYMATETPLLSIATRGCEIVEVVVGPRLVEPAGQLPPRAAWIPWTTFWPALGVARQMTVACPLPDGSSATAGSNIARPAFVKRVSVVSVPEGDRETTCRQVLAVPLQGGVASLLTNAISALPAGSSASAGPPVFNVTAPSSVAAPQSEPTGRPATCTYCGGPLSTSIAMTAFPASSTRICGVAGCCVRPFTIGTCCWATQADARAAAGAKSVTASDSAAARREKARGRGREGAIGYA